MTSEIQNLNSEERMLLSIAVPGIAKENKSSNSESLSPEEKMLLGLATGSPRKETERCFRIYNLIARNADGDVIEEFDIISTLAGRHRSQYRKMGYRVDLIEVGSGDGTVHRIVEEPIEYGRGVPNPITYDSPRIRSRRSNRGERIRSLTISAENNRLKRIAEKKQNEKCFVYLKSDNSLQFAGSPQELEVYLNYLKRKGTLDFERLIICVPDSVMRKGK
jgi:hypothetical protein